MEGLGQNLGKVNSGTEALRYLLDHDVALILMDIKMPGMDGYEAASLIQDTANARVIRRSFSSPSYERTDAQMFKGYSSSGRSIFLTKPFVPEECTAARRWRCLWICFASAGGETARPKSSEEMDAPGARAATAGSGGAVPRRRTAGRKCNWPARSSRDSSLPRGGAGCRHWWGVLPCGGCHGGRLLLITSPSTTTLWGW